MIILCTQFHRSSWEFYSKTGDLAYAIYHKSGDQDMMVPVVPHQRVNCHIATEKGEIKKSTKKTNGSRDKHVNCKEVNI